MIEFRCWLCVVFNIYLLLNTLYMIHLAMIEYAEKGKLSWEFHGGWFYLFGVLFYIPILIEGMIERKMETKNDEDKKDKEVE